MIARREARLVRLAAAGDERAFAAIYERYHQELYRYCRAILGDAQDAQDALQSTMASALRALPGEARTMKLRPWLYRVAHNEAISQLRRRTPAVEMLEVQLPPGPGAEAEFEIRERLRTLVADLSSLPERQRSALVMRELNGLSHDEIASALGVSPGAARQVVYEARLALHELEEGRTMECDHVKQAISARDRRVLRGRRIRAHLRACTRCSDFEAAIAARRADLELLAPPLSAVAASGVIAGLIGGGASTTAGAGALAGGGLGSGVLGAKAIGVMAATAAIGAGAGTVAGVDLPGLGGGDGRSPAGDPGSSAPPAAESPVEPGAAAPRATGADAANAAGSSDRATDRDATPKAAAQDGTPTKGPSRDGPGRVDALGQGATTPEGVNGNAVDLGDDGPTPPGQGNAYGHANKGLEVPGPPAVPPGLSETTSTGPPPHSNAGGSKDKAGKLEEALPEGA